MSDLTMLVTPRRSGLKAEGRTALDVLVQVQGPPLPAGIKTERPSLNLALVLDRSGSMGGRPLGACLWMPLVGFRRFHNDSQ